MARTFAQQKAGLTRALKKGPRAVLAEVARTEHEWDMMVPPYWPDDWNRWRIAALDAEQELRREEWKA